MGSQREAKCYTKESNGSQEAKGLSWLNNIHTKTRLSDLNCPGRGQLTLREYFIHYSSISLKISFLGFDVQTFGFRQWEAEGNPNVKQKNSMEAKKPKVYGCYLIFVPKRDRLMQKPTIEVNILLGDISLITVEFH